MKLSWRQGFWFLKKVWLNYLCHKEPSTWCPWGEVSAERVEPGLPPPPHWVLLLITLSAPAPHTGSSLSSHWVLPLLTLSAPAHHTECSCSSHWVLPLITLGAPAHHTGCSLSAVCAVSVSCCSISCSVTAGLNPVSHLIETGSMSSFVCEADTWDPRGQCWAEGQNPWPRLTLLQEAPEPPEWGHRAVLGCDQPLLTRGRAKWPLLSASSRCSKRQLLFPF